MEFSHVSVLLHECIELLNIRPDGIYVDATLGGGGHSAAILEQLETGALYGFDKDPEAIAAAQERLAGYKSFHAVHADFRNLKAELAARDVTQIDGALFDLGVSSHQLDRRERGFSFHDDAPLDMRMSGSGATAADLVATLSEQALADILFRYGEERYARRIAQVIVATRGEHPIKTTAQLTDVIRRAVPAKYSREEHPARRSFQALRIAVNDELGAAEQGVSDAFDMLRTGGRLAVISFHSLEDRLIKTTFTGWATGCTCPPDFPVCVCGKTPRGRIIARKPVTASAQELADNPRSRSAKLRVIEKL